jgi:Cu2+-exporting ATPase
MLTGEPIAVLKTAGDPVYAGTLNQKGSFVMTARKVGGPRCWLKSLHR